MKSEITSLTMIARTSGCLVSLSSRPSLSFFFCDSSDWVNGHHVFSLCDLDLSPVLRKNSCFVPLLLQILPAEEPVRAKKEDLVPCLITFFSFVPGLTFMTLTFPCRTQALGSEAEAVHEAWDR